MNFNSLGFLLVFLPVTLIIYWWQRRKDRNDASVIFLVLASLVFYGVSSPEGLPVLLLSLAANYCLAKLLFGKKSRALLWVGIVFDVLVLCISKYTKLFAAPGISFYTFGEIALLVEVYRSTVESLTLKEYGFLMTFFPKMIQGPITVPKDILPQLKSVKENSNTTLSWEKIYRSLLLFSFGMFKKVIIADTLGKAVNLGFDTLNSMHTGEALVIMLSYTLQLYFDFSGYCDMAMAVASFFGFELPLNFNSPYKAKNIDDFWKRWHISLTKFFTTYLYIPLGGNRKGTVRTYINFLIIFFVSGLWHGAGWQFIIWGMMHGVLYVITRIIMNRFGEKKESQTGETSEKNLKARKSVLGGIGTFFTFLYVNVAWVFFRAPSVSEALHLFKDMGECWFPRFNKDLANCFNIDEFWYVIKLLHIDRWEYGIYILMFMILVACLIMVFFLPNAVDYCKTCKIGIFTTVVMTVLIIWCVLSFEGVATYLYVNF